MRFRRPMYEVILRGEIRSEDICKQLEQENISEQAKRFKVDATCVKDATTQLLTISFIS
jgi:hypothetical protein